jgi:hypothetical protein
MWDPAPTGPSRASPTPAVPGRREAVLTIPLPPIPRVAGTMTYGALAEIEGYDLAPDRTITVAVSGSGAVATAFLESVWTLIQERRLGRLRSVRTDERGRTVAVLSVHLPEDVELGHLLGSIAVVPARLGPATAEVRVLASPHEMQRLTVALEEEGLPPSAVVVERAVQPAEASELAPEDWAFLGLLVAIGAFEGRRVSTASAIAERLDLDPGYLAERIRTLGNGMRRLVAAVFPEPATPGPPSSDPTGPT